jgi:hypothetical protein
LFVYGSVSIFGLLRQTYPKNAARIPNPLLGHQRETGGVDSWGAQESSRNSFQANQKRLQELFLLSLLKAESQPPFAVVVPAYVGTTAPGFGSTVWNLDLWKGGG